MAFLRSILAGVPLLLGACNTSPDLRDVTQIDTVEIIRNIRCETSNAVASYPPGIGSTRPPSPMASPSTRSSAMGLPAVLLSHFRCAGRKWILGLYAGVSRHREGESVVDMGEILGNLKTLDCSMPPIPRTAIRLPVRSGYARLSSGSWR